MSNVYEFPAQEQRYDEASEWLAKLDKGLSIADREALQQWMAADAENRAVLLEMAKLWDKMAVLSRLSDLFPEPAARPARSPRFALAMAASILVTVLAGVWFAIEFDSSDTPGAGEAVVAAVPDAIYETAIGEQSTVNLPDGTHVVLNTNSLIQVSYTNRYRLLKLARGEIHVQVARDKLRPLSVIARDKIVQAVGTAFSLEITGNQQVELVVTEGKVLVGEHKQLSGTAVPVRPAVLAPSAVTVTAGSELVLGATEDEIKEVSPEDMAAKLSWRRGNLVFRGESLEDAVAEIGRYTTLEFVILDDKLKKVRIAGLFRAGDIDGLLATLRENFAISHQRSGDGKIFLTSL